MEFKGSKTEKNLLAAFAGESQAKTKYEFYAEQAKKTATSKWRGFSKTPRTTRVSMPNFGSKHCMTAV